MAGPSLADIACGKDEMTPIEREAAVRSDASFDRWPCVPFAGELKCALAGVSCHDFWFCAHAMVAVERAAFLRWGCDRITVGPNTRGVTEALGGLSDYRDEGVPLEGEPVLDDWAALDAMEPVDPCASVRLRPFFLALEQLVDELADVVPVEASVGGPLTIAANLRGIERLLRDLRRAPEQVGRLLRLVVETQKRCIDGAAACGARIAMADPVANPALVGARRYEQLVFPLHRELCAYAAERCGRGPSLHMCGRTETIWHCFRELSVGEVSLDNAVDLGRAAIELGCAVPIAGNVDPVGVIAQGDARLVEAEVRRCIMVGSRSACGFTLASGCDIPLGTDPAQVDLFMDACRACGPQGRNAPSGAAPRGLADARQ